MAIKLSNEQTTAFDYLMDFSDKENENDEVTRVLYGGQVGGGKTFLICVWAQYMAMKYPGVRGYIARESLKDLKNSVLITFYEVAKETGVINHFRYNGQSDEIVFDNGSLIKLLPVAFKPSDPNFNELGSTEYTFGAIEEGINVHRKAAEILLTRTRWKHAEYDLKPKQLITCNPGDSWIKDEIVEPFYNGTLPEHTKFVRASLDSNPDKKFVKGYRKTLNSMSDEYDKARLLHGDWFALPQTGGEFYKDFNKLHHCSDKLTYEPSLPLHISFDENVNPYITMVIAQIVEKEVHIIDEICLKNPRNTLKQLCKDFERRYYAHKSGIFVYGDSTSKKDDVKLEKGYNFYDLIRQYLSKYHPKFRIPKRNPSVAMRGNFINTIFKSNFDDIKIKISYLCTNTIADLQMVKEDSDGTKKKERVKDAYTGVTYEKWGHCSDAMDYLLCEAFHNEFLKYQKGSDPIAAFYRKQRLKKPF